MGRFFYKKSLSMGPVFLQKNPSHGSNFQTEPKFSGLRIALVQGVRPFSVKISGLVCVVSHLILLSTTTARYSVIIWPSLWFTVGQHKQHWPLTIDPIENTDKKSQNWEMPEGLCMDLGLVWTWSCLQASRPSSWCCNTEVILGIQVSDVTYYA